MKITNVEKFVLRQPVVLPIGDGTQDCLVLNVYTDEGTVGIGEVHTCPTVARAIIEAPLSNFTGRGLKESIVGEDPFDTEFIWQKMYQQTAVFGRQGAAIQCMSGIDLALWDIKGKALGCPIYGVNPSG